MQIQATQMYVEVEWVKLAKWNESTNKFVK
jgi:hypothetical protein